MMRSYRITLQAKSHVDTTIDLMDVAGIQMFLSIDSLYLHSIPSQYDDHLQRADHDHTLFEFSCGKILK